MKNILLTIILLSATFLTAETIPNYVGKETFPEPYRWELLAKAGYIKDDLDRPERGYGMLGGMYRTTPRYFTAMGGGYYLFQFPVKLYAFPVHHRPALLLDAKFRPEIGPPFASWLPHGCIDIGYIYADHDWFTGHYLSTIQSLMVGGWFRLPLLTPKRGAIMVSGARAFSGTPLTRFSCYLDWYIGKYWGLTIHGDNFLRDEEGKKYSTGSLNMGAVWRW